MTTQPIGVCVHQHLTNHTVLMDITLCKRLTILLTAHIFNLRLFKDLFLLGEDPQPVHGVEGLARGELEQQGRGMLLQGLHPEQGEAVKEQQRQLC